MERHRRGVPLLDAGTRVHDARPQDRGGLDPRAPVQAGEGRHRRRQLRRRDEAVPRGRRPLPPPRPEHPALGAHQQPSRRRTRTSAASGSSWASRRTRCAASACSRDVHDIENVVVNAQKGVPTRVKDIANVDIGFSPRLGIVGHDDEPDIVQGVVLMRYGGETQPTLDGHPRAHRLHPAEPPPAARDGHRERRRGAPRLLRPRQPREADDAHRPREPRGRDAARVGRALPLPRAHARGRHHGAQHPARAAGRVLRHGRDRARRRTSSRWGRSTSASSSTRPSS